MNRRSSIGATLWAALRPEPDRSGPGPTGDNQPRRHDHRLLVQRLGLPRAIRSRSPRNERPCRRPRHARRRWRRLGSIDTAAGPGATAGSPSKQMLVLNHGSSGDWHLLIPNPQMPDVSSAAQAGVMLRVPTDYCFLLDGKPGTEILVLTITEREEDAARMRDLLAPSRPASRPPAAVVLTSSATPANVDAIRDEVEAWQRLASRDLKIEKIAQPESAGERPNSVYAVMSSSSAANRLVIEIKVRHE